jgi:hypothetical protein
VTTSDEFAEMLAQARELRLLRAVADAAWNLHLVMDFDDCPEWDALQAALDALDGSES